LNVAVTVFGGATFGDATFGDAVGASLGVSLALGPAVDGPVAVGVGVAGDFDEAGDTDEAGGAGDTAVPDGDGPVRGPANALPNPASQTAVTTTRNATPRPARINRRPISAQ
jgi:hypothetical protein